MPAPLMAAAHVRDRESEADVIAFLRGHPRRPAAPSSFASVATRHGVTPLIVGRGISGWVSRSDAEPLIAAARRAAILGELRDRQLAEALEALHAAGVAALVIKGAQLAHTCYPEPYLRPSEDSDVLIRPADCDRAIEALASKGYRLEAGATNRHALGQMLLDKPRSVGALLDVHWRMSAPVAAARLFDFEDLLDRAVPLPALGEHARGPGATDALAIACVHQAAHHPGLDRLLWSYDIHLLLATLDDDRVRSFVQMAGERGMARVCLDVIQRAAHVFPSIRADLAIAGLRAAAVDEPPSPLLRERRKVDDLRSDLSALPGWRARARHVCAHLFPPAAYMRTTYAPGSRSPLAWMYARRIGRGARRWLTNR